MTMTKKSSEFLRHFIIGDWIFSWFNIRPISFTDNFSFCEELAELRLCGFCFSLLIASQKQIHSLSTHNLRTVFQRFPSRCRPAPCSSSLWPICSSHWKWLTSENGLCSKTPFWFPLHIYLVGNKLWLPGPILVFPRIQPAGSDEFQSRGKVYSPQATDFVNCENSSIFFCHDVLSDFNCGQESCVSTNLYHSILLWKPFHSFLLLLH